VRVVESSLIPVRRPLAFRIGTMLRGTPARRLIVACCIALAAVATMQRGVLTTSHATFPIFRQSFVHLADGRNLYAAYPAEQGTEDRDLFKYNPSVP
jgi:hypothetical protein